MLPKLMCGEVRDVQINYHSDLEKDDTTTSNILRMNL